MHQRHREHQDRNCLQPVVRPDRRQHLDLGQGTGIVAPLRKGLRQGQQVVEFIQETLADPFREDPDTVDVLIVGAARNATIITNQTLLQECCTDQYRGRVMAMYMMTVGLLPLGTIPAGAIADRWGVPLALTIQGALMAAIFATLWLTRSRVRDLA